MPICRRLTKEFVDSLTVPVSGEVWIADTVVRGFGLRLWATQGVGGAAYAIRTTDQYGRVVRKAFTPNTVRFVSGVEVFAIRMQAGNPLVGQDHKVKASRLLNEAREWARTEIARLKGQLPSELEHLEAVEADQRHRKKLSSLLESRKLRYLIEKVLEYGACRGWTEQYCDRLRQAFDSFDETTSAGDLTIDELKDGRLVALFQEAKIGPATLRLLKSVLKPVLWNLHDLTNLAIGQLLPNNGSGVYPQPTEQDELIGRLELSDFEELIKHVRELPYDWQSVICIELCFHLYAPVQRVMTARWSQFANGIWWPYTPQERKNWHWRCCRIDQPEFELLTLARENIFREEIDTDFWFPSRRDPHRPIANVNRAWTALLRKLRLPKLSMSNCCQAYRQQKPIQFPVSIWEVDPIVLRRKEIQRELLGWDRPFRR